MDELQDRLKAALLGSLAADALSLGVHWIYDADTLGSLAAITDFQDPAPDSYHPDKRAGDVSHVGDQAVVLHRSLAARKGFDALDWSARWHAMWDGYPDYVDKATRHRVSEGTALPSDELAGAARIAPLVAWYGPAHREELFDAVNAQTELTHAGTMVRSAGWCLAELALCAAETGSVAGALDRIHRIDFPDLDVAGMLDQVRGLPAGGVAETIASVGELGRACPIPQALPAVLYFLVHHGSSFEEACVLNAHAGGDNCTRGLALGMVLGAAHGMEAIPARWRSVVAQRIA